MKNEILRHYVPQNDVKGVGARFPDPLPMIPSHCHPERSEGSRFSFGRPPAYGKRDSSLPAIVQDDVKGVGAQVPDPPPMVFHN